MSATSGFEALVTKVEQHPKLNRTSAQTFVTLITAPMFRPQTELEDYLRRFPEIESAKVSESIEQLLGSQLLTSTEASPGIAVIAISPMWMDKLSEAIGVKPRDLQTMARLVKKALPNRTWSLDNLGDVSGNNSQYLTWIAAIRGAKHEVIIWTMSSAYPEVLKAVSECASRSVAVRILVGSRDAVGELRGPGQADRAVSATLAWQQLSQEYDAVQVRVAVESGDLAGCGSTLIDRQVFRFTVYDYQREAGSSGQMLSIVSHQRGHSMNLISAYESLFEDSWARSQPVRKGRLDWRGWLSVARWRVQRGRSRLWLLGSAILFCAFPVAESKSPEFATHVWFSASSEMAKAAAAATLVLGAQAVLGARSERHRLRTRKARER
jgi:hypothetical protein